MRQRIFPHGWRIVMAVILAALLALPALAAGVGITLDRAPAPPQAVKRGQGTEGINFTITFQTIADRWVETVRDPSGAVVQSIVQPVPGAPSPIIDSAPFNPSSTSAIGRYQAQVDFFSSIGFESSATVTFDVADELGTLVLLKYEDLNGNGNRDAGEPGVPGWGFQLVNPQGNPSTGTTGVDGSVTLSNVPAGVWQVQEVVASGWVATTPAGGNVTVPVNGTASFVVGNVRPGVISGTVFIDVNRNGRLDAGEGGQANVKLTLTGTRADGVSVSHEVRSGAGGVYEFAFGDQLPGTYSVRVTRPGGFDLTTPQEISGVTLTSGAVRPNNDFGLARGPAQVAGGPTPNITIVKGGPETARRGQQFTYTVVVRNRSNFTARNVEVTDLLPIQLALVPPVPRGAVIRNGVVTWPIGNLRAGASRTLRMRVLVIAGVQGGRIRNTATVTADGLPPRRDTVTTRLVGPRPTPRVGGVTG